MKKHEKEGPCLSQGQPWNLCPKTKMKTKTKRKTETRARARARATGFEHPRVIE